VNRPPPPRGPGGPPPGGYPRRPNPDDPTGVTRPLPRRTDRPPPPPPRPPEIPWYQQRPDRPAPAALAVERQPPDARTDFKKLLPWLLLSVAGVALLIAVVVLISNVARFGISGGDELDVTKVENGVLQTLSDPASGYGANTVADVSCNGGRNPSARQGTTFTCDATVNGTARHVNVLVSDDRGTYEIDGPR
jgi:hypothetical protein